MSRAVPLALAVVALVLLIWGVPWSAPATTPQPAAHQVDERPSHPPRLLNDVAGGGLQAGPYVEGEDSARAPVHPSPVPPASLPEGTLEVQVLKLGEAVVGAILLTRPAGRDNAPLVADEPIEAHRRFVTDGRGIARIDTLEPAVHLVAVVRPGRPLAQARLNLIHDRSRRHVIELGDARVVGTLFDWEGSPVAGGLVFVGPATPDLSAYHDRGAGALVFVETDAGGRFEVDELVAGPTMVGAWPDSVHSRRSVLRAVNLAAGETRRVDLGRHAQQGGTWRGTVRTTSGAAVLDGSRAGRLWLSHEGGERAVVPWNPDGTFLLRLTPGRWQVAVEAPSNGVRHGLGLAVEIGEGTVEQDVLLPGARVWGHLIASDDFDPSSVSVSLRRARAGSPAGVHTTTPRADGRYELAGIPRGEYMLATWPQRTEPVQVEVGEELELRVDLSVGE